jgi:hypothetical protein
MLGLLGVATTWRSPKEAIRQEREWSWYLNLLLKDTRQTRRFASRYLENRPEENSELVVLAQLQEGIGPFSGSYVSWLRRVDDTIRSDFEMRRQISLDGWIISETEARLCVLRCRRNNS